ncbi:MAG: TIGR04283 family arsenosugar biosynthesis glycosyltransferase [Rubripirellula sp.]
MTPSDVSVVIPAINEQDAIERSIKSAFDAGATDVIVSDGGSTDRTRDLAMELGVPKVVRSLPGRGIQMNSGALLAERSFILFLHADNILGDRCLEQICQHPDVIWGAFHQRIDSQRFLYRTIEIGNACRVRWRRMAFGDQAIYVRSDQFKQMGGFAEIPLMEDVDLSKRLRKIGRPRLLDGPVTINARRWEDNGILRQTLRNWSIQLAYFSGASPERLKRRYR